MPNASASTRPDPVGVPGTPAARPARRLRERGQILPIFAIAIVLFMALCAVVIDVTWYWTNALRIQRAADAAALAGAVQLPDYPSTAFSLARAEAAKNGYTDGVAGVTVTPQVDPTSDRRLIVTISAPVGTYFARVVGLSSIPASRTARGEYILPVPMGSPENYYGVFGTLRNATFTGTTYSTGPATTGPEYPTTWPTGNWTNPSYVTANDNFWYATSATTAGSSEQFGSFPINFTGSVNRIDGITVTAGAYYSGSGWTTTDCRLAVSLSTDTATWTTWTTPYEKTLTGSEVAYTFGGPTDLWGRTWTASNFASGSFRVKLAWDPVTCSSTRKAAVDYFTVNVNYTTTTSSVTTTTTNNLLEGPGTACPNGADNCFMPDGAALNPRGFWGEMNSEGASNVNGDAYMPYYDTPTTVTSPACTTGTTRACYDPLTYYNYAVDMPAGSTNGYVYVFDPVFCATALSSGTGDRWYSGSNAFSSWYELYDTNATPYDLSDDTLIASSSSLFANVQASDSTMGGSGGSECKQQDTAYGDGRDYHDSWYLLNPGHPLSGGGLGSVYRLHTTTTDPSNGAAQRSTNGEQNFALFASATGGTPELYGLGAMQMFTPLSASGTAVSSEFYLAQIPASHAGKTLQIRLWDPGDTNPLSASLAFEQPTSTGWSPIAFSYTSSQGSNGSGAMACTASGTNVSSVTTATPTSQFNGCWLTITIPIPSTYAAPQNGWWKIKYTMNGSGTSSDVTTWTAEIQGNPVHLKLP